MPPVFAHYEPSVYRYVRHPLNDAESQARYDVAMSEHRIPRLYLREWRKVRGLTQDALAERLNTSKSVISELESGKARWNRDHLADLAFALACEPEELLVPGPQPLEPIRLVWEQIPEESRQQALAVLAAFQRAG